MMRTLAKEGIPVPQIIKLPDGKDYLSQDEKFYVLMIKLKGSNHIKFKDCGKKRR